MDEHAVQLEAKKQRIRTKKDSMEPKRKQLWYKIKKRRRWKNKMLLINKWWIMGDGER
jgi:hypothetical protein